MTAYSSGNHSPHSLVEEDIEIRSIGFIGQGYVGKAHADDFEHRGHRVVRFAKEPLYAGNHKAVASCEIVFVAVPTPTTACGVDLSIIESVIPLARIGATVVIKSTMPPGSTESFAGQFTDRFILHAPEFLRETSAAEDAAHPERIVVGIPRETPEYRERAETVLKVLPRAPFTRIVPSRAAELVKYAGNGFLYMKVVYANILHDLAVAYGVPYDELAAMLAADSRIGPSHLGVLHASGHSDRAGRGAGGHCFIKDFEAFRLLYAQTADDVHGIAVLDALKEKNNALLRESGKDIDLLEQVYGSLPQAA